MVVLISVYNEGTNAVCQVEKGADCKIFKIRSSDPKESCILALGCALKRVSITHVDIITFKVYNTLVYRKLVSMCFKKDSLKPRYEEFFSKLEWVDCKYRFIKGKGKRFSEKTEPSKAKLTGVVDLFGEEIICEGHS